MRQRIFGIETEYGLNYSPDGGARLNPEEVARYLFRKVVSWGRSSNVFLANGARLYLDVGSHPEYASAECADIPTLIAQDRAGDVILEELAADATRRLSAEGFEGKIYLFKNNTDSAGNSYGSHENYLIPRAGDFGKLADSLIPFLVTRQLIAGSGKLHRAPGKSFYSFSQRAEHMWEGLSSATTRSRPIINTRDEPHADAEKYRRLHVIVGDSSMSETTTMLKVGTVDLLLRALEASESFADLKLQNPIRSIRDTSVDLSGKAVLALADGRSFTALELQRMYLERLSDFVDREGSHHELIPRILDLWERTLSAIESGDHSQINTEIDWAIKENLLNRYQKRRALSDDSPVLAQLDLAYHDINTQRGIFRMLEASGQAARVNPHSAALEAAAHPPRTTRAAVRGKFVTAAQAAGVDFTVDWVHLKLNAYPHLTVLCKDPFAASDARVDELVAAMHDGRLV